MYFDIDTKFRQHFKNLKQVFLYIINECNLNCPQCIYKPNNYFNIGEKEINYNAAIHLLEDFHELGARKLTLLGGEPTLYGKYQGKKYLLADLIAEAKRIGYEYVRIDTNGTFSPDLLELHSFKMIDEISFSMDGYDKSSCDKIRGDGVYDLAVENIKRAVAQGYSVDITCCVYQELLEQDDDKLLLMERLIYLAADLGVKRVNFHGLIKDGTPIDLWSSDLQVCVEDWVRTYNIVSKKIEKREYPISVRIPKLFITKEEFYANPSYYGFCPAKLGERVLVHPDGIIRICSGLLGTAYGVADYYEEKIRWNSRKTNELIDHKLDVCTWCTNRSKKNYGDYVPLCFSFKPKQDEFAYNLLEWEKKSV